MGIKINPLNNCEIGLNLLQYFSDGNVYLGSASPVLLKNYFV